MYAQCKTGEWLMQSCPDCGGAMELCEAERVMVCAAPSGCGDGRLALSPVDYLDWFGDLDKYAYYKSTTKDEERIWRMTRGAEHASG